MQKFLHAIDKLEFDKVRQRIIGYASSPPGKARLLSLYPSISLDFIKFELKKVSELKRLLEEEYSLPLDGIFSVETSIQKSAIEGAILQPKELSEISSTLKAARVVKQFAAKRRDLYPAIWSSAERLYTDKVLEFNIDQAVDETGAIRNDASRELCSIRKTITDKYGQLEKRLTAILKSVSGLGLSQEEIITTREGRMVIPVKAEHKNRVHGFIHSASASGATVFIEPSETLDLNNEIRSLHFQEQREIERILRVLTEQVGNSHNQLLLNSLLLSELDAVSAKAKYSLEILGVEPEVHETGPLRLVDVRHPLLLLSHGREKTVPLNITLGENFSTLIISGPNAGGKSVAMKTVGILTLMAQSGLHIPADESTVLRVFDDIFVDIGDEQSIENDLSTFSSHLKNLKEIGEQATDKSLVLIDEIGSGTDPAEGGAIAASVLESLTKRGAYTIATTHHSALKVFASETDRVENGAMEFDQVELTPTFRFKAGIPGSSYALEMAQRLAYSEDILSRSREFMGSQQAKLEHLISRLETESQRYRTELEAIEAERRRLSALVKSYESKLAAQERELHEVRLKAINEAKDIVESANAVVERSIKEIRERAAEKEVVREVRADLQRTSNEIEASRAELMPEQPQADAGLLGIGSMVTLAGGIETGEIVSISPDAKSAIVVFGNLKMKVAMRDLEKSRERPASTTRTTVPPLDQAIARDIDLRGMTSDEAIPLVDKFIDTAMLSGLHRIDIIHGKGTGALRKKITEYLSKHPCVKSYRLGEWNEGGTGATVVELGER